MADRVQPRAFRVGPDGQIAVLLPTRRLYYPYEWYDRWYVVISDGKPRFEPVSDEDIAGWEQFTQLRAVALAQLQRPVYRPEWSPQP